MQFGLNDTGFPYGDDRIEESLSVLAEAGYDGAEPNYKEGGLLASEAGIERFAEAAADQDLAVPAVSTTVHWEHVLSSPDAAVRERGIEAGQTMVEAADALGADTALIVPGVLAADPDYETAYATALDSVREIAAHAEGTGVAVGIENVGNDMLLSPREFREFIDAASEAGPVGAYFDVGNVLYYGQHPDHWLRTLGDRVLKVHVKGYDRDSGSGMPLTGDVDWPAVAAALDDIGYDGWVTAEVGPYQHAPALTPRHILESIEAVLE